MWVDFVEGLAGIWGNIWDKLGDWFSSVLAFVLQLLPESPFQSFLIMPASVKNVLGFLNWLVPVAYISTITSAWVVAVAVYYAYSAIMRKLGAID